ncbi:MAG: VOC family protein [Candidatus Puniceispirillaceae bacterium]
MSDKIIPPFHLAFAVTDLQKTESFFVDLLGCETGRRSERWIDFDFFGHQITAHLVDGDLPSAETNPVDGEKVPSRHFGAILEWDQWQALSKRLQDAKISFLIEPQIRFAGEVGEQATMFFRDPSGNALEFKAFKDQSMIFAK